MNARELTVRQHWAGLAQGLQQDLKDYATLQQRLAAQYHAALRHDAGAMRQLAGEIGALADRLDQARRQRVMHVRALLPAHVPVSMPAALALLPPALQRQFTQLWQRLLALVQACKSDNLRNGQLIAEQAELMQTALLGKAHEAIYAPL